LPIIEIGFFGCIEANKLVCPIELLPSNLPCNLWLLQLGVSQIGDGNRALKEQLIKKNFLQRTLQFLLQLNFVDAAASETEARGRPELLLTLVRLLIRECWIIVLEQRSLWANEKK